MKMKQIWKCLKCKHEFYTPLDRKQSLLRRIFFKKEKIQCKACDELTATRLRVVKFKDKEDEEKITIFVSDDDSAEPGVQE